MVFLTLPCCFVIDRKSTRLNSSHSQISYAVFCLKKKIQDVLLLQEEFLDLPLQFVPLPDLERIRRGLEALDPTASAVDQGVHLLEASLPPFEHAVERFG